MSYLSLSKDFFHIVSRIIRKEYEKESAAFLCTSVLAALWITWWLKFLYIFWMKLTIIPSIPIFLKSIKVKKEMCLINKYWLWFSNYMNENIQIWYHYTHLYWFYPISQHFSRKFLGKTTNEKYTYYTR